MKPRRALLLSLTIMLALCAACGWWLHRERQQYRLNRQLIAALTHGDTQQALALVNAGADPNTRCVPLPSPSLPLLMGQLLHHTRLPVNTSPTAFLLACGLKGVTTRYLADPSVDLDQDLPLLQAMLAHGANVHLRTTDNDTALHGAVYSNRLATVELLLKQGANVNAQNEYGQAPLMLSIGGSDLDVFRLLLAQGADPNTQDRDGTAVLSLACHMPKAKSLLPELMAHGGDPSLRNRYGSTPLITAQTMNRPDLVRLLKHTTK